MSVAIQHRGAEQHRGADQHRGAHPLPFALELLAEQKVPLLARRTASRALALLLARSLDAPGEPVSISAAEAARQCGFEPRTWWLVKRRLLELGHLVASAGGAPPSGKPGGRGHKGAYFVAPATLERFLEQSRLGRTANDSPETENARAETLNPSGEERDLSHHRSLRLLEKKRTSDVSSLEDHERPTVESVWAWARSERSSRVKVRLLRLLETLLVTEALVREKGPGGTVMGPLEPPAETATPTTPETVHAAEHRVRPEGKKRIVRAGSPLWSGEQGEEAQVLAHVRSILDWANREHGARFDVTKVARDTLLYPFERVRSAVANVLLKKARGYAIKNAGAVLWDGITLEGYKFEEFSVACFDEVLARLGRSRPGEPPDPEPARVVAPPSPLRAFEPERRRRALLQTLYEGLAPEQREAIDRRAEALAREELGATVSEPRLRLLKVDKKNELLAALPEAIADAGESQRGRQESQIPHFGSVRDETEPNHLPATRT